MIHTYLHGQWIWAFYFINIDYIYWRPYFNSDLIKEALLSPYIYRIQSMTLAENVLVEENRWTDILIGQVPLKLCIDKSNFITTKRCMTSDFEETRIIIWYETIIRCSPFIDFFFLLLKWNSYHEAHAVNVSFPINILFHKYFY